MGRTSLIGFLAFHLPFGIFTIILDLSDTQQVDKLLTRLAADVGAIREYCGRNGGMLTKST